MAATSVGKIVLDLTVNQNQFKKQMVGIQGLAKKAGSALATAFDVEKIVAFGKECIELGSDLAEVQNVVDVTFPHMTAQVDKFAKNAATSFGLSETMAKQYTSTFGAMAKAFGVSESAAYDMGSTLTGLAGDIASFYNINQDEAYTKLKSVFTGETESLKDLGVVMTQTALDAFAMANGYGKVTANMSDAEKVALRYAFVQDKLAAAQGDFARTSDSWANQVRLLSLNFDSLKATIGQGLINLFTPIVKVINVLLSKLSTLANAFKSFTELITGNRSSGGGTASPVADLASTAGTAAAGLEDASGAAGSLDKSTKGVGKSAKKAAKEMKALMGFDQINKLDDSSDSGSDNSDSGSGIGGGGVDYGSLASGETVVDKLDSKFSKLIDRCKELAALFKKGFQIGFGDSEKRIDSINRHIKGIGQSLKDIFTDKGVVNSANRLFDAIALNAGKVAGSMANIGLTIADNLLGGIDKYLRNSKDYIKRRIISIFDVGADISNLAGDFSVAIADIFSVFSGDNGKQITASIIGIFSDAFLGSLDLAGRFSRDIIDVITTPIVENKDLIKQAIDDTLAPISQALATVHDSVKQTFEKVSAVYDEHIAPMFRVFRDGISEIVNSLLAGYEEYIVPVLDNLADKFTDVWNQYIQPTIDSAIELIGKVADLIKAIWNNVLQPFINWFAQNIWPAISPILDLIGNGFMDVLAAVSFVIDSVIQTVGGMIDILTGILNGDWKQVWEGLSNVVKGPINIIIGLANGLLLGIQAMVNGVSSALNTISIDLPDWLADLTGYPSLGFNIPRWTAPQIPYLAQGGFVKANTPQLAMIGDNRHQGEVVAPENKLQDMVDTAVRTAGANRNNDDLVRILKQILAYLIDLDVVRLDQESLRKYFISQTNKNTKSNGVCELLT